MALDRLGTIEPPARPRPARARPRTFQPTRGPPTFLWTRNYTELSSPLPRNCTILQSRHEKKIIWACTGWEAGRLHTPAPACKNALSGLVLDGKRVCTNDSYYLANGCGRTYLPTDTWFPYLPDTLRAALLPSNRHVVPLPSRHSSIDTWQFGHCNRNASRSFDAVALAVVLSQRRPPFGTEEDTDLSAEFGGAAGEGSEAEFKAAGETESVLRFGRKVQFLRAHCGPHVTSASGRVVKRAAPIQVLVCGHAPESWAPPSSLGEEPKSWGSSPREEGGRQEGVLMVNKHIAVLYLGMLRELER